MLVLLFLVTTDQSRAAKSAKKTDIPEAFTARQLRPRDPSLLLSIEAVRERLEKDHDLILIDVRKGEDFAKFRIPGSINIHLYAVKTRDYLKSRSLVLVNEGYNYFTLEMECANLRNRGFAKAWILAGGLNLWHQNGGRIEGNFFGQEKLAEIPTAGFFADKDYDDWIFFNVSSATALKANDLIPFADHISFPGKKGEFIGKLKESIAKNRSGTLPYILLFNDQGQDYNRLNGMIQSAGITNVFYLEGGLAAYETFLREQMKLRHPNKLTVEKKCKSCP